jgi:hypothetical protein
LLDHCSEDTPPDTGRTDDTETARETARSSSRPTDTRAAPSAPFKKPGPSTSTQNVNASRGLSAERSTTTLAQSTLTNTSDSSNVEEEMLTQSTTTDQPSEIADESSFNEYSTTSEPIESSSSSTIGAHIVDVSNDNQAVAFDHKSSKSVGSSELQSLSEKAETKVDVPQVESNQPSNLNPSPTATTVTFTDKFLRDTDNLKLLHEIFKACIREYFTLHAALCLKLAFRIHLKSSLPFADIPQDEFNACAASFAENNDLPYILETTDIVDFGHSGIDFFEHMAKGSATVKGFVIEEFILELQQSQLFMKSPADANLRSVFTKRKDQDFSLVAFLAVLHKYPSCVFLVSDYSIFARFTAEPKHELTTEQPGDPEARWLSENFPMLEEIYSVALKDYYTLHATLSLKPSLKQYLRSALPFSDITVDDFVRISMTFAKSKKIPSPIREDALLETGMASEKFFRHLSGNLNFLLPVSAILQFMEHPSIGKIYAVTPQDNSLKAAFTKRSKEEISYIGFISVLHKYPQCYFLNAEFDITSPLGYEPPQQSKPVQEQQPTSTLAPAPAPAPASASGVGSGMATKQSEAITAQSVAKTLSGPAPAASTASSTAGPASTPTSTTATTTTTTASSSVSSSSSFPDPVVAMASVTAAAKRVSFRADDVVPRSGSFKEEANTINTDTSNSSPVPIESKAIDEGKLNASSSENIELLEEIYDLSIREYVTVHSALFIRSSIRKFVKSTNADPELRRDEFVSAARKYMIFKNKQSPYRERDILETGVASDQFFRHLAEGAGTLVVGRRAAEFLDSLNFTQLFPVSQTDKSLLTVFKKRREQSFTYASFLALINKYPACVFMTSVFESPASRLDIPVLTISDPEQFNVRQINRPKIKSLQDSTPEKKPPVAARNLAKAIFKSFNDSLESMRKSDMVQGLMGLTPFVSGGEELSTIFHLVELLDMHPFDSLDVKDLAKMLSLGIDSFEFIKGLLNVDKFEMSRLESTIELEKPVAFTRSETNGNGSFRNRDSLGHFIPDQDYTQLRQVFDFFTPTEDDEILRDDVRDGLLALTSHFSDPASLSSLLATVERIEAAPELIDYDTFASLIGSADYLSSLEDISKSLHGK